MSRIGKKSVPVPTAVTANVSGQDVSVKGPKGELKAVLAEHVTAKLDKAAAWMCSHATSTKARSVVLGNVAHDRGEYDQRASPRATARNLEISGVGYRAAVQGKQLQLQLGYSHDVNYPIPPGITITTPKPTEIVIAGIDKQQVGQVAAEIRRFRSPEPYKGKGVKYAGEYIFRKEGKKK